MTRFGVGAVGLTRDIMIIMLRAGIAVFSLGIASAYAGDGDGYSATTLFTSIQSARPAHAASGAAQPPAVAAPNGGAAVQTSDARSQGQGTWLFRVFSLP
jgi:hypothetical protein